VAYGYESQFEAAAPQVEGILFRYLIIGHVLQIEKIQGRGGTCEISGEQDKGEA